MFRREEHPDDVFARRMTALEESHQREELAERRARHAPATRIPTTMTVLAYAVLHGSDPEGDAARALAELVLAAGESTTPGGEGSDG